MVDPILSLSISMFRSKGVFALLLGSGISRSSGIPTGWEVVQNLIRQLAVLRAESCEPSPDIWFRDTFAMEPDYSNILDEVAKTSAERAQLLRAFFEPTEDERAEGLKQPTPAHRAIATLISRGYIRVVLTTNFDRLLEQALTDMGIEAVVITSPDALRGAPPLAHTRCSIIKINGDYLDARLRNTRGELEAYEPELDALLGQVFDEYGLIVTGWSAEWDIALCAAIERCPTRRFSTYWAQVGAMSKRAEDLVAFRCASIIPIAGADSFYKELDEKLLALENLSFADPLPAKVAVSRVKRYLSQDSYRISLSDLLSHEAERVKQATSNQNFATHTTTFTGQQLTDRMKLYEVEMGVSIAVAACGGYWARSEQCDPFMRLFKRLADQAEPSTGASYLSNLRAYPALLLVYASGMTALANRNFTYLKELLYTQVRIDPYKPEKGAVAVIHSRSVMTDDVQRALPGHEKMHTPLSDYLLNYLQAPLGEYIPDKFAYEATFDLFEYLLCMVHADQRITLDDLKKKLQDSPDMHLWGPPGRFVWRWQGFGYSDNPGPASTLDGQVGAMLKARFFGAHGAEDAQKYQLIKGATDRFVKLVQNEWHIF